MLTAPESHFELLVYWLLLCQLQGTLVLLRIDTFSSQNFNVLIVKYIIDRVDLWTLSVPNIRQTIECTGGYK
jgi:hypothetical protein